MKIYLSKKEAEKDVVDGALNINDLNIQFWDNIGATIDTTGLESKAIDAKALEINALEINALDIEALTATLDIMALHIKTLDIMALNIETLDIKAIDITALEIKALLNAKVLLVKEKMLSIHALIQKLSLLK